MGFLRKNVLMKPVLAAFCPLGTVASVLGHAFYALYFIAITDCETFMIVK